VLNLIAIAILLEYQAVGYPTAIMISSVAVAAIGSEQDDHSLVHSK